MLALSQAVGTLQGNYQILVQLYPSLPFVRISFHVSPIIISCTCTVGDHTAWRQQLGDSAQEARVQVRILARCVRSQRAWLNAYSFPPSFERTSSGVSRLVRTYRPRVHSAFRPVPTGRGCGELCQTCTIWGCCWAVRRQPVAHRVSMVTFSSHRLSASSLPSSAVVWCRMVAFLRHVLSRTLSWVVIGAVM